MTAGAPDALQRLWTPYRMAYIAGERADDRHVPTGCPFCAMREHRDGDLVIHRGHSVFAVLNLHPYNPGHLMVLPYRHIGELEELTADEAAELHGVTTKAVVVLKSVSAPDAFNIGLNLGSAAGGSLSAHLHQHVVPRWTGDANFITVIGSTKMLPQLLDDTASLLVEAWEQQA
ncbi:MAG: HIT family protein [Marmoricola sp.]